MKMIRRKIRQFLYWTGLKKRSYGFSSFTVENNGQFDRNKPSYHNLGIMIPEKGSTLEELWDFGISRPSAKERGISFEDFKKQFKDGPFGYKESKTDNNEVGDPFTINLSKDNYGVPEGCPFRKWEWIKSGSDPFTKSKWGNKRLIVKVFKTWDKEPDPGMSNWGWTCTCVGVSKWALIRCFQIIYYKIKYHEKGNRSRNK